ncbi:DUF5360 family protein [Nocardia sp. XZ_19_385]|uniref:DUF5360 family protein n=1 Tax=Nocardia sp. XZ_19_385 TaxID=2769488 RepID=UPI00188E128F|nr:DUF5360 family protein [Nocardia sp. XZ_19_385]
MRLKVGKVLLLVTDALLMVYWIAVAVDAIPKDAAFRDYTNPVVQAWNWSFFPLDLAASIFGFAGVYLVRVRHRLGWIVLTVGLTLTFCAGFMAISFWAYYGDFSVVWWGSNALLMIVPALVFGLLVFDRGARTEVASEL